MTSAGSRQLSVRRAQLACEVLEERVVPEGSRGGGWLPPKPPEERPFMANEVVLRFQSATPIEDLSGFLARWLALGQPGGGPRRSGGVGGTGGGGGSSGTPAFTLASYRELLNTRENGVFISVVHAFLTPGSDLNYAINAAHTLPFVTWAQRNYIYGTDRDPRELTPNDPRYSQQYHHPLMRNNFAWDVTQGQGVVIAVTDDGVQLDHEDLAANIWRNPGEIPGNGIDDDNNGYVDDVNGWDFSANDNNPNPDGSFDDHGTHCSGIAAGRTGNGIGIAGTAGLARIMPIRFYGSGAWTSTVILNSYTYAVNNGAKIISTSYNIDGFVGDNIFLQAVNYVYNNNVLHFNSAGNNNQLNPPRQVFDQMLFVANTDNLDRKNGSSNYGFGVDISAPGTNILSTIINDYAEYSGTSMSTPNAAGVAALIWAANPTWTRDQVAAQLVATADNIDLINPTFAGLLGSGRVNSFRAVSSVANPPRVARVNGLGVNGGGMASAPTSFTVQMWGILDPTTANNSANWRLVGAGADNTFGTGDDISVSITNNTNYMIGTNRLSFTINGAVSSGRYRFIASENLRDPFGQRLDGNNDFSPGGDFIHEFSIDTSLPGPPAYGPDLFGYVGSSTTFAFQDIRTTGTVLIGTGQDDVSSQITPGMLNGFTFSFYGTVYNTLWVSSNGLITFGSSNSAFVNTDLTSSPTQACIAPFWDDLHTGTIGNVRFQVFGSGTNQELVIQWTDVRFFGGSDSETITFQVVLRRASGEIQFNYLDVTSANPSHHRGASATVGIKAAGTQSGTSLSNRLLISFNNGNNPDINDNRSILIRVQPPQPPNTPPRIVGVTVGGSGWSFSVPAGANQLLTVPWAGVNRIAVQFNEFVWIGSGQMTLQGRNTPVYSVSGFSFNTATNTATWTLATPITNDKLRIILPGTGPTPIRDMQNAPLDGAWLDTFSTFPSGSGVGGADFRFRINVLMGDVDGDRWVTAADVSAIQNNLGLSSGNPLFNVRQDINRNGTIDTDDVTLAQSMLGWGLPFGEPGGGPADPPVGGFMHPGRGSGINSRLTRPSRTFALSSLLSRSLGREVALADATFTQPRWPIRWPS